MIKLKLFPVDISSEIKAALITIDELSDLATVGDFIVAGGADKSAPGLVYEVLGGPDNSLHSTPSETGDKDHAMGSLWSVLNAGGISSTDTLVFGFGLDETGSPGSNPVIITDLEMTFNLPGGGSEYFDLDSNEDNHVFVYGNQGASGSEARFQVNLGFDFMSTFNASSTELFSISSTIDETDDGPEIYFLDAGFTATPIPEPATMLLLGSGLIGLAGFGRKKLFKK